MKKQSGLRTLSEKKTTKSAESFGDRTKTNQKLTRLREKTFYYLVDGLSVRQQTNRVDKLYLGRHIRVFLADRLFTT